MYIHHVCLVPMKSEEGIRVPAAGASELPHGCWEVNLDTYKRSKCS